MTPAGRRELFKDPYSSLLFLSYYHLPYVKYPFAAFHGDFATDLGDLLTGKITRLAWCTFRESAKSSLAKSFLLQSIANKWFNYPNVDAYDASNSERFLFDIVLNMQKNRRFVADYGHLFNAPRQNGEKQAKRVSDFVTTSGIRVEAHTTGTSMRGRLHEHYRPDLSINDDFETSVTVRSQVATKSVQEHFSEMKFGMNQKDGRELYLCNWGSDVGTVAQLCRSAENDPNFRFRAIPLVDEEGNPAWQERHVLTDAELEMPENSHKTSIETMKRESWKEDTGYADFEREMMLNPLNPSALKFSRSMFKSVERSEIDFKRTSCYLLIDPPGSARPGEFHDFCGMSLVKVDDEGFWYVEAWRSKPTPKELIDNIFELKKNENVDFVAIENTQYWQGLKVFFEEEQRKRSTFIHVTELKHTTKSKAERILTLLPRYEANSVFHVKGRCAILEEQMAGFPLLAYDDVLDSLSFGVEVCKPPGKTYGLFAQTKPGYSRPSGRRGR